MHAPCGGYAARAGAGLGGRRTSGARAPTSGRAEVRAVAGRARAAAAGAARHGAAEVVEDVAVVDERVGAAALVARVRPDARAAPRGPRWAKVEAGGVGVLAVLEVQVETAVVEIVPEFVSVGVAVEIVPEFRVWVHEAHFSGLASARRRRCRLGELARPPRAGGPPARRRRGGAVPLALAPGRWSFCLGLVHGRLPHEFRREQYSLAVRVLRGASSAEALDKVLEAGGVVATQGGAMLVLVLAGALLFRREKSLP